MIRVILYGPPGSGKGSVAEIICRRTGMRHISPGHMLRSTIRDHSVLATQIRETVREGSLVADDLVNDLVLQHVTGHQEGEDYLFDGFPRTLNQAQFLFQHIPFVDLLLELQVPDHVVISRLSGRRIHPASGRSYHIVHNPPRREGYDDVSGEALLQREDDKESALQIRLALYRQQALSLSIFFKDMQQRGAIGQYIPLDASCALPELSRAIHRLF